MSKGDSIRLPNKITYATICAGMFRTNEQVVDGKLVYRTVCRLNTYFRLMEVNNDKFSIRELIDRKENIMTYKVYGQWHKSKN